MTPLNHCLEEASINSFTSMPLRSFRGYQHPCPRRMEQQQQPHWKEGNSNGEGAAEALPPPACILGEQHISCESCYLPQSSSFVEPE